MDENLRVIVERFSRDLRDWLDQPSATSTKIAQIRSEFDALGGTLTGDGRKAARKALDDAEAEATRQRQREAAEAIAENCRALGVRLEARDAPKRAGRKPSGKSRSKGSKTDPSSD